MSDNIANTYEGAEDWARAATSEGNPERSSAASLRAWCRDYDGSPIPAEGDPMPGFTAGHIRDAAARMEQLEGALERALTGGNHLANVLIRNIGPDFADKYPPDMPPEEALRWLCATDTYDVWCCWSAIMQARNVIGGK